MGTFHKRNGFYTVQITLHQPHTYFTEIKYKKGIFNNNYL